VSGGAAPLICNLAVDLFECSECLLCGGRDPLICNLAVDGCE
jgi:hypothetical protein